MDVVKCELVITLCWTSVNRGLSLYLAIYLHAHHLKTFIQLHFGKGLCGQQRSKQISPFSTEEHGPDSLDVCWPLLAGGRAVNCTWLRSQTGSYSESSC